MIDMEKNFESDFHFVVEGIAGHTPIGFPDYNWKLVIYSKDNSLRKFRAGCTDGQCYNCFDDDGKIHVVCNAHGLPPGELWGKFYANVPNGIFPDGKELSVAPFPLGITLVTGAGDEITDAQVQVMLPYIYLSAYDLAVSQGYEGTAEEYVGALTRLPEIIEEVEVAEQNREEAESARVNVFNTIKSEAETATTAANEAVVELRRNTFAVEYDRATGKLYAVSDSDDTILQDASLDRTTGKLTLTFEY